jgi:hypothetical protein
VLLAMCEKCAEIDRKIEHLKRMIEHWAPRTIEAAKRQAKPTTQ